MTNLIAHLSKDRVTVRLIELILNMAEAEQRNLLQELEIRHPGMKRKRPREQRKHSRKTSLIAVECRTNDALFTDFIQNISNGGVFIETDAPFYIDQEIILNFSLSNVENAIIVRGKVVRVDPKGIGVKFIRGDVNEPELEG
jgi:Tfp pilus assembly protein PilZ